MCDIVDQKVKTILETTGVDAPFIPFDHIFHLFLNIMANSSLGEKFVTIFKNIIIA